MRADRDKYLLSPSSIDPISAMTAVIFVFSAQRQLVPQQSPSSPPVLFPLLHLQMMKKRRRTPLFVLLVAQVPARTVDCLLIWQVGAKVWVHRLVTETHATIVGSDGQNRDHPTLFQHLS